MSEKKVARRSGNGVKPSAAGAAGAKSGAAGAGKGASRSAVAGTASTSWVADVRANQIVSVLGNKRAAEMLRVSESQPSRWRKAIEVPSPQVAAALVDLDHIIARLQLVWDGAVIGDWLEGPNAFLEGSRPIDVLLLHGSVPVLEAIEAEASGAYA